MNCPKCGTDMGNSSVCPKCGAQVAVARDKNATIIGVVFGVILGLIGLLGLLIYPTGSIGRSSFMKGWIWGFVISIVASIIFSIIYYTYFSETIMGLLG